jgi:hypothetical protein
MQDQESLSSVSSYGAQGGSIGAAPKTPIFLPKSAIAECKSFRDACHLAWENRTRKNLKFSHMASEIEDFYASHASEYFAKEEITKKGKKRRELPAKHVNAVQQELGNYAISQWQARDAMLTLMEEVINSQRGSL